MTIRWEFAYAARIDLELWDAKKIESETSEILKPEELALTMGYDEVFAVVGTREQLREFAARVLAEAEAWPQTVEDEDEEDVT